MITRGALSINGIGEHSSADAPFGRDGRRTTHDTAVFCVACYVRVACLWGRNQMADVASADWGSDGGNDGWQLVEFSSEFGRIERLTRNPSLCRQGIDGAGSGSWRGTM